MKNNLGARGNAISGVFSAFSMLPLLISLTAVMIYNNNPLLTNQK